MSDKVILLDGAVGTSLWEKTENKVPVWRYNIENPAIVSELHGEYIDAGAKIVLANTFGANRGAVSRSGYSVNEIVSEGVRLAKAAANGKSGAKVKVALSVGPLSQLIEPYGELTGDEAADIYREQIAAGMSEQPDMIMLQTFMDVEMMRIALLEANKYDVPVFVSMSFEKSGRTMMGNSVADVIDRLADLPKAAIGLNCSLGPDLALPVIKQFTEATDIPVMFKPNAGTPIMSGGKAESGLSAEVFVGDVLPAAKLGVKYIGGCCGTNAVYIKLLGEKLREAGAME